MTILAGIIKVHLPYAHSLKEKRKTLKSLMAKIAQRHSASVREIDSHDAHQIITLGFSLTTLSETEARDVTYAIEQTIWKTIESEGNLLQFSVECLPFLGT
ncbi:MAG: DUF503 domain-containing protein [Treponema sp.]|nr:DUF503 domain-containing protein [Treponema sp.]